jgi:hypothetical protein
MSKGHPEKSLSSIRYYKDAKYQFRRWSSDVRHRTCGYMLTLKKKDAKYQFRRWSSDVRHRTRGYMLTHKKKTRSISLDAGRQMLDIGRVATCLRFKKKTRSIASLQVQVQCLTSNVQRLFSPLTLSPSSPASKLPPRLPLWLPKRLGKRYPQN